MIRAVIHESCTAGSATLCWLCLCLLLLGSELARPAVVAAQAAPTHVPAQPPPGASLRAPEIAPKHLKQGRALLAAGVGLTLGGLAGLGIGLTKHACHGDDVATERFKIPAIAGGVVAGAGIAFTIGGGIRIAGVPREERSKHAASPFTSLLGLGVAAGAALTMFVLSIPERVSCGTS